MFITAPSHEVAKIIGEKLVESNLAACVNIIPGVESIYKWEGKINRDKELLLMLKTKTSLVDEISNVVKSLHPYEVPEVISVSLSEQGNTKYLEWVKNSCGNK